MRTPEVEIAISNTKAGMYCTDDADTLAAEVERLEAELVKANEAARAAMYAIDERAFLAECAEKSEKRAEAAEARVKELEAEALNSRHAVFTNLKAQLAAANEQNARLRAALEDQLKLAEKQVEFYKDRVDSGEEHLRPFGSEAWRRAKDLKKALSGEEAK